MLYSVKKTKLLVVLNSIFVSLFILTDLLHRYKLTKIFYLLRFIILFAFIIQKFKYIRVNEFQFIFLLFMNAMMLLMDIRTDNVSIVAYFQNVTFLLASIIFFQKKINAKYMLFSFLLVFAFFWIKIQSGIDPNHILAIQSRNYVSALSINAVLLYYFVAKINGNKVLIFPSILNLLICLFTFGRSGIIVGVAIFIIVLMHSFYYASKKLKLFYILVFVVASVIAIRHFADIEIFDLFRQFENRGMKSDGRKELLKEYFNIMKNEDISFLFGVKLSDDPILRAYFLNPHNSFLTLHADYGLIACFLCFLFFAFVFFVGFITKEFFLCALLGVSLMRIFIDTLAFPGLYDGFIYACSFYIFQNFRKYKYIFSSKNINGV